MRYKIGPLEEWFSNPLIRLENGAFENTFQIGKEERFLHLTFELSVILERKG